MARLFFSIHSYEIQDEKSMMNVRCFPTTRLGRAVTCPYQAKHDFINWGFKLSEVRRQGYDTATPRLNWKKPGSFLWKPTSIVGVDHIQQHNGKHSQCRRLFAGSVPHHYVGGRRSLK